MVKDTVMNIRCVYLYNPISPQSLHLYLYLSGYGFWSMVDLYRVFAPQGGIFWWISQGILVILKWGFCHNFKISYRDNFSRFWPLNWTKTLLHTKCPRLEHDQRNL